MRDMASQGPYFSELLLNAIYFISSKHISSGQGKGACDITDTCNTGTVFRRNIESLLYNNGGQLLCKSSITTIQALLLFSDALFSWCDERSLSWHYLGIAANMIIDLGIHSEGSRLMSRKSENPEAIEIHRRVFWAAFGKGNSLILYHYSNLLNCNHSLRQDTIYLPRSASSVARHRQQRANLILG